MKSNTYELHNYTELHMELDSDRKATEVKDAIDAPGLRKRKASNAASSRHGEKYSLRQKRQKRSLGAELASSQPPSPADEAQPETAAAAATTTAARKTRGSGKSPAKTKAPPLSKYRRKTANARERTRMREINMAFEQLRHCVPQSITGEDAANTNEKLTKITTLRLAMKYIGMLSESLQDPSYESEFLVECLRESANREAHVSMDTEPEAEPEYEPELAPTPPAKPKKQTKGSKKTTGKRQSKAAKAANATASSSPESCYASSSVGSPAFCAAACSPSSAYASLSSSASSSSSSGGSINGSAPIDADSLLDMRALSELNTLLMESDSESMPCLDPHVNTNSYHSLLATAGSGLPARGDLPISMHSPLDKPDVELSLRLLDHSTDSFDFATDQQPSACISPLATLDSYHPFSDLLHGEFPDIFLA